LFAPCAGVQESGFAEEFVGLIDIDQNLAALLRHSADFYFAVNNQINVGGRLILVVNDLPLSILQDAGTGEVC
jgi:hypothetical protein